MIEAVVQLSVLVFVIGTMAAMGLTFSVAQIRAPLSDVRMLGLALFLNFVLSPVLALLIAWLLGLDTVLSTGLLLMGTAAGAPFLPKLAQAAKADVASAVGLMVVLMGLTVVYVPLVLPLLLAGVVVDSWAIARSLILMMLLPLGLGLAARARYGEAVEPVRAVLAQASNVALILILVFSVAFNFRSMVGLVGSNGLIAAMIFIAVLVAAGYLLGGSVMALATAQRNIAAAVLIAGQNFGIDVVTYVLVASLLMLVTLLPLAGELGRRSGMTASGSGSGARQD